MRAKLYLLGAVLGAAPGLLPCAPTPTALQVQGRPHQQAPGGGPQRQGRVSWVPQPTAPQPTAPQPMAPASAPKQEPVQSEGVPTHPCELVTALRVPCDESQATCEYTYWQCPRSVKPLRA